MAADNGHIEVLEMLLDKNANIEAANEVSRNVIIACTALRLILTVIIISIHIIIIIFLLSLFLSLLLSLSFLLLLSTFLLLVLNSYFLFSIFSIVSILTI